MFTIGAVLSFTLLEGLLSKGFRRPMPQHHTQVQALGTALNVLSVLGGLGAAWLLGSLMSHQAVWGVAPFIGAIVYLVMESLETALAERVLVGGGDRGAGDLAVAVAFPCDVHRQPTSRRFNSSQYRGCCCPSPPDPSRVTRVPRGRRKNLTCRREVSDMPASSIKDEKQYQALRREGASKEKAARISNASAKSSRSQTGRKGGSSGSYEDWTKTDLLERAREIGISGRSKMSKSDLVDALRNH